MTNSKDYEQIRIIIHEIVGVNTRQGELLKVTVKKYFEDKPPSIKLVNHKSVDCDNYIVRNNSIPKDAEMEQALDSYTKNIKKGIEKLRATNKYYGIEWDT